jgi:hypothetical protein
MVRPTYQPLQLAQLVTLTLSMSLSVNIVVVLVYRIADAI